MKESGGGAERNLQRAEGGRSGRDIIHLNQIAHQTQTANFQIVIAILVQILCRRHHQKSAAQVMTSVGGGRNIQKGIDTGVQKGKEKGGVKKGVKGVNEN